MYPENDVPIMQWSIDKTKNIHYHYRLGKQLSFLRREGVLIAGSGNMVHNLRMALPGVKGFNNRFEYEWARKLNESMKEAIRSHNHKALLHYYDLTKEAKLGVPTEEHYIPLIYALALQSPDDHIEIFNDRIVAGSLSMTSVIIKDKNG